MNKPILAICLALGAMSASAASSSTTYSATWDFESPYSVHFSGSFSGEDVNGDEFLTEDELQTFNADFINESRVYKGFVAQVYDIVSFRYRLFAPNLLDGIMTLNASVYTCDYYACAETADDYEDVTLTFDFVPADLTWNPPAPIPVPASGLLLAPMLGLFAVRRKRRT